MKVQTCLFLNVPTPGSSQEFPLSIAPFESVGKAEDVVVVVRPTAGVVLDKMGAAEVRGPEIDAAGQVVSVVVLVTVVVTVVVGGGGNDLSCQVSWVRGEGQRGEEQQQGWSGEHDCEVE